MIFNNILSNSLIFYLLPEIFFAISLIIIFCTYFIERNFYFIFFITIQFLILLLYNYFNSFIFLFNFNFWLSSNNFIIFFKIFMVFFFILFLFLFFYFSIQSLKNFFLILDSYILNFFEFIFITLIFIFSGFLFIMSNEFLLSYILLEIQSVALYIMAIYNYENNRSSEVTLKYFIFGVLFSGFYLVGWLLLFAITGLSNIYAIVDHLQILLIYNSINISYYDFLYLEFLDYISYSFKLVFLGFFLIFLCFIAKLGLFPFHNWVIDIYEGLSIFSIFFFSIFPKIFYIIFLVRIFYFFYLINYDIILNYFQIFEYFWNFIIFIVSILSIIIGSISNLSQWTFRRFIAYSSLVNLGYIFIFFYSYTYNFNNFLIGISFNLVVYIILLFLLFILFIYNRKCNNNNFVGDINELFLFRNNNDITGLIYIILMLSFIGVPPFLGFYSKFYLLYFLFENKFYFVFFIILFLSVIISFYYIRLGRLFFNIHSIYNLLHILNYNIYFILYFIFLIHLVFIIFFFNYFNLFCTFICLF